MWYAVALLLLLQATSSFAQSLEWVNHPLTAVGGADEGRAIARDASGNVYVTGYFSGTADFDPDPGTAANLTSAGFADIFIAKYDASGNYLWAKRVGGGAGNDVGYGLAVDGSGNVYMTGSFQGTDVDFDPGRGHGEPDERGHC